MKPRVKQVMNCGLVRWVADLRCFNAGRKFFETEDEAKVYLEAKAEEVRNHGITALNLSHEDRIQFLMAKEKLAPVGAKVLEAVEFFLRYHKAKESRTLKDAYEEFMESKRRSGKRPRYLLALEYSIGRFIKSIENRDCTVVTRKQVESWVFKKGLSLRTCQSYLIDVRTFFRFCKTRGYIMDDPCGAIEAITLDEKPPGILTVEQCEALLETARTFGNGRLLPYVTLALFTGIRPQEVLRLGWENVKLDRGFVEVPAAKSKTRQRRIVDLSENAVAWLKLGGPLPPVNQKEWITAIRRKAGIIEWPQDALRHSFASYHLAKHGSADKTATQLGHRSTEMLFEHYRELVTKDEAEKFWTILPAAKSEEADANAPALNP